CGQVGHWSRECPKPKKNAQHAQKGPGGSQQQHRAPQQHVQKGKLVKKHGQVYFTTVSNIPEGEPVMIGRFPVANHPAVVLFDSGASHSFISRTFVIKHELPMGELKESFCILSPGGRINTKEVVRSIPVIPLNGPLSWVETLCLIVSC
ncbi:hypothetical protein, partial [Haemophilus sp. SZY H54]